MALLSLSSFVAALRDYRLLPPNVGKAPAELIDRFPDTRALAKEFLSRNWLTAYQVNQLLNGRGKDLLLGSYVLLEKLGEGGMGAVFKARNWKLDRVVALKLIRKERLTNPDAIRRFHREIRAAAQLNHANIVRAFDADEVDGTHLLVMELVEGGMDLARLVKERGPLPVDAACDYMRQAALGLQHAFERGLVHRDIKPHNLLVVSGGVVSGKTSQDTPASTHHSPLTTHQIKILDMGLARLGEGDKGEDSSSTLTQEGAVMGTLDYIAPEQARDSHSVDIRADLYSLGCTLFFLLTGRVPFPGGTAAQKLMKHQLDVPPSVQSIRPEVSAGVAAIVSRLMAKRPEDRFATPAELAVALANPAAVTVNTLANRTAPETSFAAATFIAPPNVFADLHVGDTMVAQSTPEPHKVRVAPPAVPWKWLAAGAGAVVFVVVLLVIFLSGGSNAPKKEGGEAIVIKKKPKKDPPSLTPEELAALKRDAEDDKRKADADQALKPLMAKWQSANLNFTDLAKEVAAFRMKHGGTPAAITATSFLMRPRSPLDALDPEQIPPVAKKHWQDKSMIVPPDLVAVFEPSKQEGPVLAIAFSPDGKFLAAARGDTITIWDLTAPGKTRTLKGHEGPVVCLAYSPDGALLASSGQDATVRLWDLQGDKDAVVLRGNTNRVSHVSFAPNGKTLASGGSSIEVPGALKLWDLAAGKERAGFKGPPTVWITTFGADPSTLINYVAESGHIIRRRDLSTEDDKVLFEGSFVHSLAASPDGKTLAIGHSGDKAVRLVGIETNQPALAFAGLDGTILGLAYHPTGKTVAGGDAKGRLVIWDSASGSPVYAWLLPDGIQRLAYAPDGRHLATANANGTVYVFRLDESPPSALTAEQAKKLQEAGAKELGVPAQIENSIAMKLNFIPAGRFLMGSPEHESGRSAQEGPQHIVTLTQPFYLGTTEVTQEQYEKVIGKNPSRFNKANGGGPGYPVDRVSWDDAVEFCKKLSELEDEKKAGRTYRLPTEAEWEYACRAGTQTAYSFGDDPKDLVKHAWFLDNSPKSSGPVAALAANAWGLYDMHGNMWEWCLDVSRTFAADPVTDPRGAADGPGRALRGGGVSTEATWRAPELRSAYRYINHSIDGAASNVGFRVVMQDLARPTPPLAPTFDEAKTQQDQAAKKAGFAVQVDNSVGMKLNFIPSGRFLMGSPSTEAGQRANEGPQHEVTLTKPFYLGIHEVTQEQYEKVTGANPSHFSAANGGGPKNPADNISWHDAVEFCKKLSTLAAERDAGRAYRLPTEAEWEYACRAGSVTAFSFGDDPKKLDDYAWYADNDQKHTHPVGTRKANAWGLFDMHGNAWELCADLYLPHYYRHSPARDPKGPAWAPMTLLRGGAIANPWTEARSANRWPDWPLDARMQRVGFRVVMEQMKPAN